MNKYFKTEKKKNNKIYVAIATIVAIVGIISFFKTGTNTDNASVNKQVVTQEAKPQKELITARVDITTPLVDANTPQFEVYVDDSDKPLKQAVWMSKYNIQGCVALKDGGSMDILIKVLKDSDIKILLKGIWDKNTNGKIIEHWVKYKVFTINDVEILTEPTEVWHNEPFTHTIDAEAGDEYKVHIEWENNGKV